MEEFKMKETNEFKIETIEVVFKLIMDQLAIEDDIRLKASMDICTKRHEMVADLTKLVNELNQSMPKVIK